jgi:hypothetical protein
LGNDPAGVGLVFGPRNVTSWQNGV